MAIQAIITLVCDTPDLAGVRGMLDQAARLGTPATTCLLDGSHIRIEGESRMSFEHDETLAGLAAWAAAHDALPGSTLVEHADALAIDLPLYAVEESSCGDHMTFDVRNVLVTVNEQCKAEPQCVP